MASPRFELMERAGGMALLLSDGVRKEEIPILKSKRSARTFHGPKSNALERMIGRDSLQVKTGKRREAMR